MDAGGAANPLAAQPAGQLASGALVLFMCLVAAARGCGRPQELRCARAAAVGHSCGGMCRVACGIA